MIDGHTAFGFILGAFILGMLVMEWSAHNAADINRRDAVPFDDHVDQAWEVIEKTVIP